MSDQDKIKGIGDGFIGAGDWQLPSGTIHCPPVSVGFAHPGGVGVYTIHNEYQAETKENPVGQQYPIKAKFYRASETEPYLTVEVVDAHGTAVDLGNGAAELHALAMKADAIISDNAANWAARCTEASKLADTWKRQHDAVTERLGQLLDANKRQINRLNRAREVVSTRLTQARADKHAALQKVADLEQQLRANPNTAVIEARAILDQARAENSKTQRNATIVGLQQQLNAAQGGIEVKDKIIARLTAERDEWKLKCANAGTEAAKVQEARYQGQIVGLQGDIERKNRFQSQLAQNNRALREKNEVLQDERDEALEKLDKRKEHGGTSRWLVDQLQTALTTANKEVERQREIITHGSKTIDAAREAFGPGGIANDEFLVEGVRRLVLALTEVKREEEHLHILCKVATGQVDRMIQGGVGAETRKQLAEALESIVQKDVEIGVLNKRLADQANRSLTGTFEFAKSLRRALGLKEGDQENILQAAERVCRERDQCIQEADKAAGRYAKTLGDCRDEIRGLHTELGILDRSLQHANTANVECNRKRQEAERLRQVSDDNHASFVTETLKRGGQYLQRGHIFDGIEHMCNKLDSLSMSPSSQAPNYKSMYEEANTRRQDCDKALVYVRQVLSLNSGEDLLEGAKRVRLEADHNKTLCEEKSRLLHHYITIGDERAEVLREIRSILDCPIDADLLKWCKAHEERYTVLGKKLEDSEKLHDQRAGVLQQAIDGMSSWKICAEQFSRDALAVLSGAGIVTPAEGYIKAGGFKRDLEVLAERARNEKQMCQRIRDGVREALGAPSDADTVDYAADIMARLVAADRDQKELSATIWDIRRALGCPDCAHLLDWVKNTCNVDLIARALRDKYDAQSKLSLQTHQHDRAVAEAKKYHDAFNILRECCHVSPGEHEDVVEDLKRITRDVFNQRDAAVRKAETLDKELVEIRALVPVRYTRKALPAVTVATLVKAWIRDMKCGKDAQEWREAHRLAEAAYQDADVEVKKWRHELERIWNAVPQEISKNYNFEQTSEVFAAWVDWIEGLKTKWNAELEAVKNERDQAVLVYKVHSGVNAAIWAQVPADLRKGIFPYDVSDAVRAWTDRLTVERDQQKEWVHEEIRNHQDTKDAIARLLPTGYKCAQGEESIGAVRRYVESVHAMHEAIINEGVLIEDGVRAYEMQDNQVAQFAIGYSTKLAEKTHSLVSGPVQKRTMLLSDSYSRKVYLAPVNTKREDVAGGGYPAAVVTWVVSASTGKYPKDQGEREVKS